MSSSSPSSPSETIKKRTLGFLIWQSIFTTITYFFLLYISSFSLLSFLSFHLSSLLLSLPLSLLSSPHPHPSASLPSLLASLLKSLLVGGFGSSSSVRARVVRSLLSGSFVLMAAAAGAVAVVSVVGDEMVVAGVVLGLGFGGEYLWHRRWVLKFPIVQRPLFYRFRAGLSSSVIQALKLSTLAFIFSNVVVIFLPDQLKSRRTGWQFIIQLIDLYIGMSAVSFCWELIHHLLQVLHTKSCSFAPPQGSAAAEANPTEPLLEALEQSTNRSLLQYLAYLDLCMVSESNIEPWRRAAFFEESGETYRRIVTVCLRPLEQLTSSLAEGLVGICTDKSDILSQQLISPTDFNADSKLHEAFNDLQICTWCARTVATLTARSRFEDRYGVAQLTTCNSAVVSSLLSTLTAVEAVLGKKTSSQPANFMGPASIRWANGSAGRKDVQVSTSSKKRDGAVYSKAYTMADVLKTSIYAVVSAFQADMQANAKASVLEKSWIVDGTPLYGSRDMLVKKLSLFLDYRAN